MCCSSSLAPVNMPSYCEVNPMIEKLKSMFEERFIIPFLYAFRINKPNVYNYRFIINKIELVTDPENDENQRTIKIIEILNISFVFLYSTISSGSKKTNYTNFESTINYEFNKQIGDNYKLKNVTFSRQKVEETIRDKANHTNKSNTIEIPPLRIPIMDFYNVRNIDLILKLPKI